MSVLLGRNPKLTLLRAGALVASAIVVFGWILLPLRLAGISMLPTYRDGALNFANRAAYWGRDPARGDVVAIRMAGNSAFLVKRIVALPGEQIAISEGTVLIDGRPLEEIDVVLRSPWNMQPMTLGADEYFVIGDNRSMPMANHDLGRVARGRIVGKLLY